MVWTQNRIGVALAIAGAAMFAFRPILVKLIYAYEVESVTIMLWRMLFALPVYVGLIWYLLGKKNRQLVLSRQNLLRAGAVGICGYYVAALLDLIGLQYVSAQLGRMILYTYPTMVTLLGWWLLKTSVHPTTWWALALSYLGIGLIFFYDFNHYGPDVARGTLWILASSASFSLYMIYSKQLITELGSRLFTCIAMIAASLAIISHYLIVSTVDNSANFVEAIPEFSPLALIFIMSMGCTVIPSFLISGAIQRIGASSTSIAGNIGPAVTVGFAVLLLGESFTLSHLAGFVLVLAAITLTTGRS